MKKLGLIGKNIKYSKSSLLHQKIGEIFGEEINYDLIDVDEREVLKIINLKKYDGLNITKPYKELAVTATHKLSPIAKKIKAINTIYYKDGKIYGDNTDFYGFKYLIKYHNIDVKDKKIAILGTGGAAKSIFYFLKMQSINVFYVSRSRKDDLTISYDDFQNHDFDIIVNATPVGNYNNPDNSPLAKNQVLDKIVIDLNYNPKVSLLMSYAKKSYNGLIMLIVQALYAHKRWNLKDVKINKKNIEKIKEALDV